MSKNPFWRGATRIGAVGVASFALALSMAPLSISVADEPPSTSVSSPLLAIEAAFSDPPTEVRPMYRWWMPLAYTDDDVLREQLRELAASGAGGVEVAPFVVAGPGNQSDAFLTEYGWGTPLWAHKMEVITGEAAELGLQVDQNLGPHYPPTVPNLNSFNQPEAEQQLLFGWEVNQPGQIRTGPLPPTTEAPPSVSTSLVDAATVGQTDLSVRSLGGLAVGDIVTIGAGETVEQVEVLATGDRLADSLEVKVSPLQFDHGAGDPLVNVAQVTRLRTLVAQCAGDCDPNDGPVELDVDTVIDVTSEVVEGGLEYSYADSESPWVVMDFVQTASGLIGQRGGYTATQPNYVPDHLSRDGVEIQAEFWDEHVLTPTVRANLARIGRGAIFEDSIEHGESQKWTWGFIEEFGERRGYDLTTWLPALAGVGIQGVDEPVFELDGMGPKVREDYRQTVSDLYVEEYVASMQEWAQGHGLEYRAQSYGLPISTPYASSAVGVPEGESLNFASPNPFGAEQSYRAVSAGAHLSRKNIVSVECCAAFMGGYRSSLAGPNIGGQWTDSGQVGQLGGAKSQGLLDSVYKSFAGGVNQLVWHGLAYPDAPRGVGVDGRDGGTWPGYQPWDIFGALNVNDAFGPRQPNWEHFLEISDALARTQLVLREGTARLDLGVYYEDLGLAGSSVSPQQTPHHMLGTDSATSIAGYTYEYVAPEYLAEPGLTPDAEGGLFSDRSAYKAMILNQQRTISLDGAERLEDLAGQGLNIFVVGEVPVETTGVDTDPGRLSEVVESLLAQPTVRQVASENDLPAALATAGIQPAVAPQDPSSALGFVRRVSDGITYDFIYNRSQSYVHQDLEINAPGNPYLLNTWTGEIEALGEYHRVGDEVTVPVSIAPYDIAIIATAEVEAPDMRIHAIDSTGKVLAAGEGGLKLRVTEGGMYYSTLSDGSVVSTRVEGVAPTQVLEEWILQAQTWGPDEDATELTASRTTKVDHPEFQVSAGEDGSLPSWLELEEAPVDLSTASGVGTYTTQFTLPDTWTAEDGVYLALGDVLDTAQVEINGKVVTVNQADKNGIDLGGHLRPGSNTLVVTVATTLFNAVRSTGDSNYQSQAWQRTGLMGPVTITPYRDSLLEGDPKPDPTPTVTVTAPQVPLPTATVTASPEPGRDLYETPGFHQSSGRSWMTVCEAYSSKVDRCWTHIWGTTVHQSGSAFYQVNGWQFNNLTYIGGTRADWASNPLGHTGRWTAEDGRQWRTECDTANTGRNGCRSYNIASLIERDGNTYRWVTKEVFNNQVRFR